MSEQISGIHHITAIASDPQRNVDFYAGLLGLRLVKKTVNFDDPGTYHLYFGDALGHPGTILTFFPWPGAQRGRRGVGEISAVSFSAPVDSMQYWMERCRSHGVKVEGPHTRFGDEQYLAIEDPDGMAVELTADASELDTVWDQSAVPREHALRGFHSATLDEEGYERTATLLTETFGFALERQDQNRFRYRAAGAGPGVLLDVVCAPDARRGVMGAGSVHHIAWRTATDAAQLEWRERIAKLGYNVTPVMDREYFHSIYFREPGGVLFEIATDPPGFTVDETVAQLGSHLKLPPWLEPQRTRLERVLPRLTLPEGK
jgi:glyoxalase family protein